VIVSPNNHQIISLEPEFITPQDGSIKQDCELNAAKRWIERNEQLAKKRAIILGDDLFSREPFCKLLLSKGFHFILVCKPDSHKTLYEWVDSFEKTNDISTFTTVNGMVVFMNIGVTVISTICPLKMAKMYLGLIGLK